MIANKLINILFKCAQKIFPGGGDAKRGKSLKTNNYINHFFNPG